MKFANNSQQLTYVSGAETVGAETAGAEMSQRREVPAPKRWAPKWWRRNGGAEMSCSAIRHPKVYSWLDLINFASSQYCQPLQFVLVPPAFSAPECPIFPERHNIRVWCGLLGPLTAIVIWSAFSWIVPVHCPAAFVKSSYLTVHPWSPSSLSSTLVFSTIFELSVK